MPLGTLLTPTRSAGLVNRRFPFPRLAPKLTLVSNLGSYKMPQIAQNRPYSPESSRRPTDSGRPRFARPAPAQSVWDHISPRTLAATAAAGCLIGQTLALTITGEWDRLMTPFGAVFVALPVFVAFVTALLVHATKD